jgi:hypothetical protein
MPGIKKELIKFWKKNKTASLHEMGVRFLVTRERIRQLLTEYDKEGYLKSRENMPSKATLFKTTCKQCQKEIIYPKGKPTPKYCSIKCRAVAKTKYKTPEERREATRRSLRNSYYRMLQDPVRAKHHKEYGRDYIRNRVKRALLAQKARLTEQFNKKIKELIK